MWNVLITVTVISADCSSETDEVILLTAEEANTKKQLPSTFFELQSWQHSAKCWNIPAPTRERSSSLLPDILQGTISATPFAPSSACSDVNSKFGRSGTLLRFVFFPFIKALIQYTVQCSCQTNQDDMTRLSN